MSGVRASVIVVTYNHRDTIRTCLDALLPTLGQNDEVIVVDNASSDGTADVVAAEYSRVALVRTEHNLGFGGANNLAAARSRAEYLVFLNPDTAPRLGWLDALLAGLSSAPHVGLATARLLLARTPDRIDTFGHDVHISGIATCRGWNQPASSHSRLEEVAAVSGACFATSRDLFQRLGGFYEPLFLYYEDDELSLRARLAGYTCVGVPDAIVEHDHTPGFSPAKLRYLERNRLWSLLRLLEVRTLLALVPVLLVAELAAWSMAALNGPAHVLALATARLDLLKSLPDLPRQRREVARLRVTSDAALLRLHGAHLPAAQVSSSPLSRLLESAATRLFGTGRALATRLTA